MFPVVVVEIVLEMGPFGELGSDIMTVVREAQDEYVISEPVALKELEVELDPADVGEEEKE